MDSASRPSGVSRMKSASSIGMARYTFRMKALVWLAAAGVVIALIHFIRRWRRQWLERQEAAEQRMAMFIAQAKPAVPTVSAAPQPVVAVPGVAPQERLL